jgi:hypothetical protein
MEYLSLDILAHYVVPYLPENQFLFAASVNHKFLFAYTDKYPKKVTYYNVDTIEHAKVCYDGTENRPMGRKRLCALAAKKGNLLVLQFLRNELDCPWDACTCAAAAENGHFEVLQWARINGCPWNAEVCRHAAHNGQLDVLQWARANDCPWNLQVCAHAALNGHLEVLQWAHANGCPWDDSTCGNAAINGHIELLKRLSLG